MATFHFALRTFFAAALFVSAISTSSASFGAQVIFDLPETIECRDVTPAEFAPAHPNLKVVEGKFRISARVVDGTLSEIVDFLYVLESAVKSMRVRDYLPNTTLESIVACDEIEITNANEHSKSSGAEAHVVYKPITVGGSYNQASKKSQISHYKQIAAKDLVLASGTTNREHGVFFRLRPSRISSLEGAKEFTFLATVPKTWRGDLCTISCAARATKRSLISTSVVPAGANQVQVGMYLAGDAEAADLAEELRRAQETRAAMLTAGPAKDSVLETISIQASGLFLGKKSESQARTELKDAERNVDDVQNRLKQLAR